MRSANIFPTLGVVDCGIISQYVAVWLILVYILEL